jgi:hypothetical protein
MSWAVIVFWVINMAWRICFNFKEPEHTETFAFTQEGGGGGEISFMSVASIGPQALDPAPPETQIYLYIILFLQPILFPFRFYLQGNA